MGTAAAAGLLACGEQVCHKTCLRRSPERAPTCDSRHKILDTLSCSLHGNLCNRQAQRGAGLLSTHVHTCPHMEGTAMAQRQPASRFGVALGLWRKARETEGRAARSAPARAAVSKHPRAALAA